MSANTQQNAQIKAAADKLDAAMRCHPAAVNTLVAEALAILDGAQEFTAGELVGYQDWIHDLERWNKDEICPRNPNRKQRPLYASQRVPAADPDGWADAAMPPDIERRLAPWLTNGAALHPLTINLVVRFSRALAAKLAAAEVKHGYRDGWRSPDWMDECREKLAEHVAKGDPRDVAAYCAFLWHHGATTATPAEAAAASAPSTVAVQAVASDRLVHDLTGHNPEDLTGRWADSIRTRGQARWNQIIAIASKVAQGTPTGVRCHNDACCGGQVPCPTRKECGLDGPSNQGGAA